MIENIKRINSRFFLDYFFLFIFLLTLPISNVTAIQNISIFMFILLIIITNNKIYKNIIKIKKYLYLILGIIFLALISILFSIDPKETISEIRGEILKPFIISLFIFIFMLKRNIKEIYTVILLILISLFVHSVINLIVWYEGGLWPFRAGGLVDSGGGERFGIWATYALSISFALFFTKYRNIGIVLFVVFLLSIIANNTRATFVGTILIFIFYFIFFYSNKIIKFASLFMLLLFLVIFTFYSKNFDTRYNVYNMISKIKHLDNYSPNDYDKLVKEHSLGNSSIVRLAMWKSVFLYRVNEPFIPLGYGRFLFDKQIKDIWINNSQNIPYKIYKQAHNDFLSIFLSLGIFGLSFFILFLYYLLKINYFIFKYNKEFKFVGVFIFLGTIGYIASMMFGSFFGDSEQLYFYALYGISLALYVKTKEEFYAEN